MSRWARALPAGFLHVWFYVLLGVITVLVSPFLFLFSLRKKDYPYFFWVGRNIWARGILYGMGQIPVVKELDDVSKRPCILMANHTSMLDIMFMYLISRRPFVFVGKKELAKFPVFGFFYKRVSILVDRESVRSRQAAYRSAQEYIEKGLSISIFPEGGIPDENLILADFKDGAFRLSIENNLPMAPIVFLNNKKNFPYSFKRGRIGVTRALVLPLVECPPQTPSTDKRDEVKRLKEQVRRRMLEILEKYSASESKHLKDRRLNEI